MNGEKNEILNFFNKMKNASELAENKTTLIQKLKKKYSDHSNTLEQEDTIKDCLTLLNILDATPSKDPRITIELAKLKKENNSLRKELSKFFPNKDSIESASKKLENLFQVDSVSLLRYENAELREKNEKLNKEIFGLKQEIKENLAALASEQVSLAKLKEILGNLQNENTNLILYNREILKKNKVYEEQSKVVENLQKKLRSALLDNDKGKKFVESNDEESQTEEILQKPSKLLARLKEKNAGKVEGFEETQGFSELAKKIELKICKNLESIRIQGNFAEKPKRVASPDEKNQKIAQKQQNFIITQENTLLIRSSFRKPQKSNEKAKISVFKSTKQDSILIKPLKLKPKLNLTKPLSTSFQPITSKKPKTLKISKTTSASLIPPKKKIVSKPTQPKKLQIFPEISINISKPKPKILLTTQKIYSKVEYEEVEVFNALTVYKPELSISHIEYLGIKGYDPILKIENFASISCKKSKISLKLSKFQVFVKKSPEITLSVFKTVNKTTNLEIVVLRRYNFAPVLSNTDDEETKSNSGSSRKRSRQPVRKPAIEEYFNLVLNI